ncbi:ATP-dependent DNA ligase [Leucobacter sp. CSA1]|uniref:DNA ligase (ATP) n=1 Tax=Leucobacter chromiisoli TaxID=2796471 RepID=A0A934Q701_9MICO|nr:ATP-dependent DNA ligase [Leucobacter chromiisoli]MBK0418853.1 ATP-dependent DNA ligase [Leucobacter chromiisoli]
MAGSHQMVTIGGRRIRLSSLDRVLYPSTGTTKGDVIGYCSAIAPVMLPHCRDRAATRKRWPRGVGEDGSADFFFQKDLGEGAPDWVETRSIQHRDHVNRYPLVNDEATLVWLAQLSALEVHVPQWRFGRGDEQLPPDRMVLDLDPGEGVGLRECAQVARLVRDILADMGLESIPVTSGSKGIHLYAALDGRQSSDEVSAVARELARSLEADHPDEVTSSMKRSLRPGKVFIDWSQNNASKTTVAPYSLRGRVRPTVAAPRTWRELASPHLRQLEYHEVLQRVERRGDPLAAIAERAAGGGERLDRLSRYRSMRDAGVTPEPVPERIEVRPRGGDLEPLRFVIQRHEARRLHYDFRLEHDGVLVSWALPKGVPTDPARNHLAVPTEDHPMEYRFFEGEIPKGEYGAGTVEIWDSGTYELEKWREDEVIATLTGTAGGGLGGTRRLALFRTQPDPKPSWMIHLMELKTGGADRQNHAGMRPMLATRASPEQLERLDEQRWAFEMKWDGIRALATLDGGDVGLMSRSGAEITDAYPELGRLAEVVAADGAVLDGEIVAFGEDGAPSFGRLQTRMGLSGAREVARARSVAPVSLLLFDVLSVNGEDCRRLAYEQRRGLLLEMIDDDPAVPVALPPAFEGDAAEAIAASRRLHLEGIVAKRRESPYRSGARSLDWLKIPLFETAEVVVVGWRRSEADALGLASLLLATVHDGELRYAGRVGTGFSNADRRAIRRRLSGIEQASPPVAVPGADRVDAHWVTPELVAEVTYKQLTASGRLRQAVWRGWRPDKSVDDVADPVVAAVGAGEGA